MKQQFGYRYLVKNIGLITLSSFATKLLSFFLVPLYTSILSTTEYGTYDLFNATIGVLLPILTLNIQEAVLRFSLDKKTSQESIVTISSKYFLISNTLVALGLIINYFGCFISIDIKYSILFFLMFFVQSFSGIITCYVRGIDKVADLSISSVITSAVTICCNILFLAIFRWGLIGYFIANIIGPFTQCIYLIIRSQYLKRIKLGKYAVEEKEFLSYSKPLIANSIAWWVNNVSDRYVILFFCGLAENGIYSVAGKIPSILHIFQVIFNSAWTLSVVKDYDSQDSSGFFSNTYRAYNCFMVILCSSIIFTNKFLARIIYANDFFLAWKYVPWLTISIVFGALSGYLGGFFSAVKDSKIFATSTMLGAGINLCMNIVLTPFYGAMGSAVATAICYFIVWVFRYFHVKKYIKLKINVCRDLFVYILMVVQAFITLVMDGGVMYFGSGIIFVSICILFFSDIRLVVWKVLKRK